MTRDEFETVVEEALATLPREFRERLQNVRVIIADYPSPQQLRSVGARGKYSLLGLYEGVPLTRRTLDPPLFPDTITLFRKPLLAHCGSVEQLRAQIRHTVLHEIAHFFGISDDRLRELDAY